MSEAETNAVTEAAEELPAEAAEAADAPKAVKSDVVDGTQLPVPEILRSATEQVVDGSREAYERTKDAMENTVEMLEASIDRAGQGAVALNRKVIDIAQTNLNSGFDLAKDLSGAKTVTELLEAQAAFARKQFETFTVQAEEFRNLSARVATETAEPLKSHMSRSIEDLGRH